MVSEAAAESWKGHGDLRRCSSFSKDGKLPMRDNLTCLESAMEERLDLYLE